MDEKLKKTFISTFLRLRRAKSKFLINRNIGWGELMLLRRLMLDSNLSEIREMLQISKPAVTHMLNSFEKRGYIIRSIDLNDRRRFDITLTSEGRQIVEDHKNTYENFFDDVFTRFGEKNTKDFIKLFNRFADVIDEVKEKRKNE